MDPGSTSLPPAQPQLRLSFRTFLPLARADDHECRDEVAGAVTCISEPIAATQQMSKMRATSFASPLVCRSALRQRALLPRSPFLAFARTSQRNFTASAPRQTAYETIVALPVGLLDCIHAVGAPWAVAIPAAAVLVRGVLVYYTCVLPSRKAMNAQYRMMPLIDSKTLHDLRQEKMRKSAMKKTRPSISTLAAQYWRASKIMNDTLGKFGYRYRKLRVLLNFLILIIMAEAIRMKCGAREGLLHSLVIAVRRIREVFGSAVTAPAFPSDMHSLSAADAETHVAPQHDEEVVDKAAEAAARRANSRFYDATMTGEGLGSAIDLTVPDCERRLPLMLLCLMMLQGWMNLPRNGRSPYPNAHAKDVHEPIEVANRLSQRTKRIRHLIFSNGMAVMFYTLASVELPAGVVLYLLANGVVSLVQSRWLRFRYPNPTMIRMCKRPLSMTQPRVPIYRESRGN